MNADGMATVARRSASALLMPSMFLLALGAPMSARAQARDAAGSEWLFREGRALMKKGDFAAACPKLAESYRFDPAVGTLMNLAECEERLGRTASAWQRWGAAAEQLPSSDRRRATALTHARALEGSLPRLIVTVADKAPQDLVITRDGITLGPASLGVALPVDPGRHVIVASASGHTMRSFEVVLENGQQQSVIVEPGAATLEPPPVASPAGATGAPATAGPVAAALSTPARTARRASPRAAGMALMIAGGTMIAVGGYFGLQALSARREASEACANLGGSNRCWSTAAEPLDRDRRSSLAADIAFAAGAVTTAAGLYLALRRRSSSSEVTAAAQIVPVKQGGGVQLAGRF
jgi:hypothetical protein